MPQIAKETVGVVGLAPRERMQQQTVHAPTPQVLEETVELGRLVLHERVQQRTAEHFEDAPQHQEETVEMVRLVSHERVQQRAAEQTEDLSQSPEGTVETVRSRFGSSHFLFERARCFSCSRALLVLPCPSVYNPLLFSPTCSHGTCE